MRKFIIFLNSTAIGILLIFGMVSAGQGNELPGNLNLEKHIESQIFPHIRILGFESEETLIHDIMKKLGPAQLVKFKGGHHGQGRLCYISDQPNDTTLVYFYEHAIGGTNLQTFEIMKRETGFDKKVCTESSEIHENIKTDSGLGLNLSLSQVIAKMGLPYRYDQTKNPDESKLIYQLIFDDSMTAEQIKTYEADESPFFGVIFGAEFKIRNDKVIFISISKTSTY
jgi:hypothetical protein